MTKLANYDDMVAAFLAKKAVTVVAAGVRAIESDKTIYAAMREGVRAAADEVRADRDAEALHHRQYDAFAEGRYNGMSTADAHKQAQETR